MATAVQSGRLGNGSLYGPFTNGPVAVMQRSWQSVSTPGWPLPPGSAIPWHHYSTQTWAWNGAIGPGKARGSGQTVQGYNDSLYRITYSNSAINGQGVENNIQVINTLQSEMATSCINATNNELRRKAKNMQVNVLQNLAERHQVYSMLGNTANRVAHAYTSFKRGNVRGVVESLALKRGQPWTKTIASNWLEYQYGWRPLLSDLYDGLVAYYTNSRPKIYRVSTVRSRLKNVVNTVNNVGYTRQQSDVLIVKVKGIVDFTIDDNRLDQASSLGVLDPELLAWELLPYSFVVDWFTNIGDYLSSLNLYGINFSRGLLDIHQQRELQTNYSSKFLIGAGIGNAFLQGFPSGTFAVEGDHHASVYWFERSLMGSFPTGSIVLKDNPFSPTHIANALALVSVAFQGGKGSFDPNLIKKKH
jgi:hypothetical protein